MRIRNLILIGSIASSILFTSCKKDEETNNTNQTTATITVTDSSNKIVTGHMVYAYKQKTWENFSDDPSLADKKISTNSEGKAIIKLDDIINLFAFDSQEAMHFSVHYNLNGTNKTKTTTITFEEGEQKSGSISLN